MFSGCLPNRSSDLRINGYTPLEPAAVDPGRGLVFGPRAPYTYDMSKRSNRARPAEKTEHRWRISRIRGTPAALLGHVYAPDQKTALQKAAEQFQVRPELVDRLVARRDG
jgi:hypothetical protein